MTSAKEWRALFYRWLKALVLVTIATSSAHAGVGGGDTTVAAIASPRAGIPATSNFADRIDTLIAGRWAIMDQVAPQPAANSHDPKAVARRLAALQDLDAFARMTIDGLIAAAPSSELRILTSEELTPVLLVHQEEITAALVELMALPLVQEQGWFVISRFGAEADRNAGRLVRSAAIDPAYKGQLLIKLRELAMRGEAGADVVQLISEGVKKTSHQ